MHGYTHIHTWMCLVFPTQHFIPQTSDGIISDWMETQRCDIWSLKELLSSLSVLCHECTGEAASCFQNECIPLGESCFLSSHQDVEHRFDATTQVSDATSHVASKGVDAVLLRVPATFPTNATRTKSITACSGTQPRRNWCKVELR